MGIYRRWWIAASSLVAFCGLPVAVIVLPRSSAVTVALFGFLAVALTGRQMYKTAHGNSVHGLPFGLLARAGLAGAVIAVAVTSLSAAFGVAASVLALLLAVACPPSVRRDLVSAVRHVEPPDPVPPVRAATPPAPVAAPQPARAEPPRPLPDAGAVSQLSTDRLCWWWRTSFVLLQRETSPEHRLRIAELRHVVLDELAERDPESFARWLHDGARAGSDPARYFAEGRICRPERPGARNDTRPVNEQGDPHV